MTKTPAHLGFTGMILGSIALLLALIQFGAGPFSPQPGLEQTVVEKAIAIKQATTNALKGKKVAPPATKTPMDIDQMISLASLILGGLAIILGVFAVAKQEPWRAAGGAAVLGCCAIAFKFLAIALGAIILLILIIAVLSQIGIG